MATPTPGPGTARSACLQWRASTRSVALGLDVGPGDFAENITTQGIDLLRLSIGDRLHVGTCDLEITQIGKECHARCAIFEAVGDCVMPREGVFARVIAGGDVRPGDGVSLIAAASSEPQPTP